MRSAPVAKPLLGAAGGFPCVRLYLLAISLFLSPTLAGCNDCFYLSSWQSQMVWFLRLLFANANFYL